MLSDFPSDPIPTQLVKFYNDLLHLRKYLTGFGRTENETLTYLMSEKLQWMQSHGVTGYEKD
jgi:hypothetical protein